MSWNLPLLTGDFEVVETQFALPTTATIIAKQNPTRWALIFCDAGSAGDIQVSLRGTVGTTLGIKLLTTGAIVTFDFGTYGALVSQAWYGRSAGGTSIVTVIEVLYRPQG